MEKISEDGRFLHEREQSAIQTVVQNVSVDVSANMDELIRVLADGTLQLTDDERTNRINLLYQKSNDQLQFILHYKTEAKVLVRNRASQKADIERLRILNN